MVSMVVSEIDQNTHLNAAFLKTFLNVQSMFEYGRFLGPGMIPTLNLVLCQDLGGETLHDEYAESPQYRRL